MAAHEYAFTLTPGNSSRTRSLAIAGAAIAAVCVLSSAVVMRELVGPPTARAAVATTTAATTTAATTDVATTGVATTVRTWALEPRWWQGEIKQILRPAATTPDPELTFAKGYQLRLAARQAAQQAAQPASAPAQIAAGPIAESQPGRTATVRKATTIAHTDMPPVRRVSTTPVEPGADPFAQFDTGTRALAYDAQRPSERGVAYRSAPQRGLFGTLY